MLALELTFSVNGKYTSYNVLVGVDGVWTAYVRSNVCTHAHVHTHTHTHTHATSAMQYLTMHL